jgi:hypothetical protein
MIGIAFTMSGHIKLTRTPNGADYVRNTPIGVKIAVYTIGTLLWPIFLMVRIFGRI